MSANHSHGHSHGSASSRMGMAFFLNLVFAIIELVGGLYTNSLAILSDAFHDMGDALAIAMAWYLEKKSRQGSTLEFSYGYRRLSVLGAMITGLILMCGSGIILARAIPRLFNPEPTNVQGMLLLAILGLAVNGFAAFRMSKGTSLNEKMILWHLLEDVMGWIAIFVGSIVMMVYDLPILDPIMAIGIAIWVLWNVFNNLKTTFNVFLQATPTDVQIETVTAKIKQTPQVKSVHHLHLWSMDGDHHILTTHLVVEDTTSKDEVHQLKIDLKKTLMKEFHITEATIEVEWPNQSCTDPIH
jgi:cobalt-zinc-cadmium efflux system protein